MMYLVLSFFYLFVSIPRILVHCSLTTNSGYFEESLCGDRAKDVLINAVLPGFEFRGYFFIIWEGKCGLELSRIWMNNNSIKCCHTSVSFDINSFSFNHIMQHLKNIPNKPPFLKSTTVIWLLSWQRTLDAFTLIQRNVSLQSVTQQRSAHLILSIYDDFAIPPFELTSHLISGMTVYVVIIHQRKYYAYSAEYLFGNFSLIPLNLEFSRKIIVQPSNKLINMNGRELVICSIPEHPFSSVTKNSNGSVTWNNGFDMKLITILANHFNFSVKMMFPDEIEISGKKLEPNWHSIIKALRFRKVNLGIAQLVTTKNRSEKVDFGRYYFSEPLVIVTKKPGLLPRTFIVFRPFKSMIWLMIGLSFFVFAFAFLISSIISQRLLRNRKIYFNLRTFSEYLWLTFGCFIRAFPIRVPEITNQRLLVVFWGFFSLILTAVYQGSLTSHLTIPIQEFPVDSLRDLSDKMDNSGVTWIATSGSSHMDRFTDNPTGIYKILNDKRLNRKIVTPKRSAHDNIQIVLNENVAFFVGATTASYETAKIGKDKFHIGKRGFFTQQYSIAFQRGSPLLIQFNDVVSRVVESGITDRWVQEFVVELEYKNYESKKSGKNDNTIELEDLQGAFLLLFTGYAISMSVFLAELFLRRSKSR